MAAAKADDWLLKLPEDLVSSKDSTGVYLFQANPDAYLRQSAKLVKRLNDLGYFCVYVTLNRTHRDLEAIMAHESIDPARVFFADAVTLQSGGVKSDADNVIYLSSPRDLTELCIAIDALSPKLIKGKKFVLLDSLTTLYLYHSESGIARFVHFLSSKLRSESMSGILVSLPQDEKASQSIKPFCDGVILG